VYQMIFSNAIIVEIRDTIGAMSYSRGSGAWLKIMRF